MSRYLRKLPLLLFIFMTVFMETNLLAQRIPVIIIHDPLTQKKIPMKMSDLKIDVKVVGNLALTTMEMNFYNGNAQVLEGELYFPLGEGQTVSRFAMDVNGKLREGVVVEKAKGRQVFETIVRQNIDPGLLEWSKGNNFKARIYPIPAKGHKKVVIAYEQELIDGGKGFLYSLPMNFKDKVDNFSVRAEVFRQEIAPNMGDNELANFAFKKWNESYIAEQNFENYIPNKNLAFVLPKVADRQRIFVEESEDKIDENYFYINLDLKILTEKKDLPKKICLLWDASNSAAAKDIAKEIEFLDNYLAQIGNVKVELVVFRNEVEKSQKFSVKAGAWDKLKETLNSIQYDGGTQLGALDLKKYKCDEFILSSDGLSNFGESEMKLSKTPVLVLNSSASADHSYLNYIARASSGAYINMLNRTMDEAFKIATTNAFSFLSAEYKGGVIKEVYPSIPTMITKDFSISGMLLKDAAEIKLNFGFGDNVKYSKTIKLNKKALKSESGLIKRVWGQKKIAELDLTYDKNEEEITSIGKELSIVTRNTSLIVLDRLEDYIQHKIVPPEGMQEEYYAAINKQKEEKALQEKNHLDDIARKFELRKEWWNTEFKFGDGIPKKKDRKNGETTGSEESVEEDGVLYDRAEYSMSAPPPSAEPEMMADTPMAMTRMREKKEGGSNKGASGSITLKKWEPDTPYLNDIKGAPEKDRYDIYMKYKKEYDNSSAYYLDMADFFMEKGRKDIALRILSNIAEMELENHQLLRILGYRLKQLGYYDLAIFVFTEVLKIREEEPQSYRDLGLTYADNKEYQKAVEYLYSVVKREWDSRFPEIELIAVNEMNSVIAACGKTLDLKDIDKRLLMNMPVDIRVILTWDADLCDMDLWVTDPNGEKCFYSHPKTYIGGLMSKDFTRGYGPEEFLLKKAQPGKYKIEVNYYGNTQQVIAGATTIQVLLTTGFGTENEKNEAITLRLKDQKEVVDVGEFEFKLNK